MSTSLVTWESERIFSDDKTADLSIRSQIEYTNFISNFFYHPTLANPGASRARRGSRSRRLCSRPPRARAPATPDPVLDVQVPSYRHLHSSSRWSHTNSRSLQNVTSLHSRPWGSSLVHFRHDTSSLWASDFWSLKFVVLVKNWFAGSERCRTQSVICRAGRLSSCVRSARGYTRSAWKKWFIMGGWGKNIIKFWNNISITGCKWSNSNAQGSGTPVSHSLLGDSLSPFSAPASSSLWGNKEFDLPERKVNKRAMAL